MNCQACSVALDSRATFCPNCGATVPDPLLQTVVAGRYQVEKRIAIGTFGSVYRATQLDRHREVALKVMHRELAADAALVARFRREGDVLLKLKDRHAVATYEVGEAPDGLPFIAMELLEGETLLRLFHLNGRMPWRRVFSIVRGMCNALAEAHALGVVHRDLKPANIFLTSDEVVKILDFGIAKIMSNSELGNPQELTVMGTAIGTVEYMAPEQLMGGKADGRTDIYTLGVLAYELITGKRPFNAAGLELLTVQLTDTPAPPSQTVADMPPAADEVLLKCLAQDTTDRYQDVRELQAAIDNVLVATSARVPLPLRAPKPTVHPPLTGQHPVVADSDVTQDDDYPVIETMSVRKQSSIPPTVTALVIGVLVAGFGAVLWYLT